MDIPDNEHARGTFAAIKAVARPTTLTLAGKAFHDETKAKGSTVISMKNDWKRIFDWEK